MQLDLSEAVEAAARAYLNVEAPGLRSVDDQLTNWAADRPWLRPTVEAVAPIIERQVREQIAREIEAHRFNQRWTVPAGADIESVALHNAAKKHAAIARGDTHAATMPLTYVDGSKPTSTGGK